MNRALLALCAMGLLSIDSAVAAPCDVPASYATLAQALADSNCDPIDVAAGEYLVSASVDRSVQITGGGAAQTRLYAQGPGESVLTLTPTADLTLQGVALLVNQSTPETLAISVQAGALLRMGDVRIGNAPPPAPPLIFDDGFE